MDIASQADGDDAALAARIFDIFVNTRPKKHIGVRIQFDRVVELSDVKLGENEEYYVAYSEGPPRNPEGEMTPGQFVRIQDGMVFDVSTTYRS